MSIPATAPLSPSIRAVGEREPSSVLVDHVTVGYRGKERLHDVSVHLGPGLHVLLGHNGAGKTTLFRTLTGVLRPTSGTVLIDGLDTRDPRAKIRVAVAGHRPALAPRLSVLDNVEYWARVLALPSAARSRRVAAVMDELELGEIAGQRAATVSRGQAQRIGLAKALLTEPSVLLLDEPLSGVDPGVAARVRTQLRSLAVAGRTVLISSHELAELGDIGDDVTVLREGRVVAHGTAAQLRDQLVGSGYRLRLRGTSGLAEAVAEAGYETVLGRNGAIEVQVSDDDATRALVDRLVGGGHGLYEISPAENALTDIYLSLNKDETG